MCHFKYCRLCSTAVLFNAETETLIMYCNGLTQKSKHKVKFTTDFQMAARQGFQDVS